MQRQHALCRLYQNAGSESLFCCGMYGMARVIVQPAIFDLESLTGHVAVSLAVVAGLLSHRHCKMIWPFCL